MRALWAGCYHSSVLALVTTTTLKCGEEAICLYAKGHGHGTPIILWIAAAIAIAMLAVFLWLRGRRRPGEAL